MKKITKFISLFTVAALLTSCAADQLKNNQNINSPRDYELTIMFTGNTNGQINSNYESIGLTKAATILSDLKEQNGKNNVLYLNSGNTFTDNIDQGKAITKILNAMGLAATTLGENDFKLGTKNIKTLEMRSNFKFVAGNIKKKNGQNFFTPYIIKSIKGKKVGIFGLVTPDLYNTTNSLDKDLTIEEPIICANEIIKKLKSSGVDYIIALTYLGMDSLHKEWEVTSLANSVSGIDIILDGNNSYPTQENLFINNTPIVQVGENFENIGIIKIDFDAPKNDPHKTIVKLIKKEDSGFLKINSDNETSQKIIPTTSNTNFITHTIVKGDTLYSLAKKYGTTVDNIVAINPSITDGETISIGQTYNMIENTTNTTKYFNNKYIEYTVKKGDTLYSLAKKYGTTVDNIVAINPSITDGETISIGQTYNIPNGN